MRHREIGGYFELERAGYEPYYKDGIYLNSARNALKYIIRVFNIKEIALSYFTCPVVYDAAESEGIKILSYEIDDNFMPEDEFSAETFFLYTDYFGISGKNAKILEKKYPNLIVDNAQAFFAPKKGIASFYSPRKFFGLPDGGILISDKYLSDIELKKSVSYDKFAHLLKRADLGANSGYPDFRKAEEDLKSAPVLKMSDLTYGIMSNINYQKIMQKRLENFRVLNKVLSEKNELKIDMTKDDIPLCYPFRTKEKGLREKLIENKIYTASYWPQNNKNQAMSTNKAKTLRDEIIPLPVDQRYDKFDMERILDVICK